MKKLAKYFVSKVSGITKTGNMVFQSINKLKQNITRNRQTQFYSVESTIIPEQLLKEKEVLNGPFKGMVYPDLFAAGSMLYPKLIGSYEFELHSLLNSILKKGYTQYIDIGCAEGYYAVGFALNAPECTVHAFDINGKAIEQCRKMAQVNKVNEKLFTYSSCDATTLAAFDFTNKTFILADCEGFEKELFNNNNIASFKHADLLIEVHDFVDDSISSVLLSLFSKTHKVSIVTSINDYQRPFIIDYPELAGFDYNSKYTLLEEKRPELMQWFFFESCA